MTWTKCNPEDPTTYPLNGQEVLFALRSQIPYRLGAWFAIGRWETDGRNYGMDEVTHWQPLLPLPGEEREQPRATVPGLIRELYACRGALLDKQDAGTIDPREGVRLGLHERVIDALEHCERKRLCGDRP